jgi:L-cystine transport system ATP-binding protein
MSAIDVRNLVKKFHGQTVLHGIDLDVKPGEVVAIIGPSGSGQNYAAAQHQPAGAAGGGHH